MSTLMHNKDAFTVKPSLVLCDLDNTLYAYDPAHEAALNAVIQKMLGSFNLTCEQVLEGYDAARKEVKARLGKTASSHSRLLYCQAMLEKLELGSQPLLALDLDQTYWHTFLNHAPLFDGVLEFLDDLRLAQIPAIIVTDLTSVVQLKKMVYFGLEGYFDYIVTSEEAGIDKPDPAPYKLALEKAGHTEGAVWMIGDSPTSDMQGGRSAIGAVTLQKRHKGVKLAEGKHKADMIFDDFSTLSDLIKKLA